jgi:hypothetical protein
MIHSATTTGPPLDVDCEPSRSESFDSEYDVSDSENDACASDSEYHVSDSENDACDSDSEYDVSDSENEVCDSNSECDVSDSDPDCDVSDFHYDSAVNEPGNSDKDVGLLRPASSTENEIEKHKHILRLQQRLLREKRKKSKVGK